MASSVVASASHSHHQHMDRLDAARALLGVSPTESSKSPETIPLAPTSSTTASSSTKAAQPTLLENEVRSSDIKSNPSAVVPSHLIRPTTTTVTSSTAATTTVTTASTPFGGIPYGNRTVPLSNDPAEGSAGKGAPPLAPPPILWSAPSSNGAQNASISSFLKLAPPKSNNGLCGLDALAALAIEEQANIMAEQQQKQEIKVKLAAPAKISFSAQPLIPHSSTPFNAAGAGAGAGTPFNAAVAAGASTPPNAALNSNVVATLSSSDDDSEAMPPPPPRRGGRRRSVSNPEGMEKWDPFSRNSSRSYRRHFVLPASILEEELAEANAAVSRQEQGIAEEDEQQEEESISSYQVLPPGHLQMNGLKSQPKSMEDSSSSASTIDRSVSIVSNDSVQVSSGSDVGATKEKEDVPTIQEEEECLSPDEMLRRARSRLLEDLSEGSLNGDKGVLTLPHSLSKYKEVYNKNGRIGIYTPAERAAIIARFNNKRSRRVWNKKIRYNCRKNLADRRMRVKGRFVKRSAEQHSTSSVKEQTPSLSTSATSAAPIPAGAQVVSEVGAKSSSPSNANNTKNNVRFTTATSALPPTPEAINENDDENGALPPDEDMPDVNDPDAGFAPTEDQPYRRLRRHTIT